MDQADLMKILEKNGYEAYIDEAGVVTARIDPWEKSSGELWELVEKAGWNRSFGIKYTRRPKEWETASKASCSASGKTSAGKAGGSGMEKKHKESRQREPLNMAAAGSGRQMSIFDFMGGK